MDAVIFDMDGVIVDSEPLHQKVLHEMTEEWGIIVPQEERQSFVGLKDEEVFTHLKANYGLQEDVPRMVEQYIDRYIKKLAREGPVPVPGAIPLIRELKARKIPLALASSSPKDAILLVLTHLRLQPDFSHVVSGEDVTHSKPEPDIFLKAAKLLQVNPNHCLVIEDSYNGVQAAKQAGMTCIGLRNPLSGNQDLGAADRIVDSLKELDVSFL